jgi:Domain of unknown function (DUF4384)
MKIIPAVIGMGFVATGWTFAQQAAQPQDAHPVEGARELYYLAVKRKDVLPAIHKAALPAKSSNATTLTGAVHLGLRYNLVLVNPNSGSSEAVDPERVLHSGECFALDFEANRSGYLYVLAKQSSGSWQALVPSFEMAEESNIIDPSKKVRVPSRYCFEVHDPPGTETLFVVLSRDPRDFYELYEGIKKQSGQPAPSVPDRPSNPVQLADAGIVNSAVAHMARQFGTRDIAIRKFDRPASPQEPPHSVYVVSTADTPTSSVVAQIEVRHR